MEYKGYYGSANFSAEDKTFHGKLENIRSLISYQGDDVKSLEESFHEAVEDYLETCKHQNIKPEVPFKGSFNVRISPELHREAVLLANSKNVSLNEIVGEAVGKLTHAAYGSGHGGAPYRSVAKRMTRAKR